MATEITASTVRIRRALAEDAQLCGSICYEAFAEINSKHGFPPDLPSAEAGVEFFKMLLSHPAFFIVVAEVDGQVVGSNCLDERSVIAGIGPITISPSAQSHGVGRLLMQAVLDRTKERSAPGVRLLQSAFHNRSLSLYAKLGFDAREPISMLQGPALKKSIAGYTVRPATTDDVAAATRLCERVHGHSREGELRDGIKQGSAVVVERNGQFTGYASEVGFFGHAVGESNLDLQAMLGAADSFPGPGVLIPTRNAELFRWCLENGLRVVYQLTLMTIGLYNEPQGAYLPSVLF